MNKNIQHILLFTFGVLFSNINVCFSQEYIQKDSSNINVKHFKEAIQERYKGDDFNYSINDRHFLRVCRPSNSTIPLIPFILKHLYPQLNSLIFVVNLDIVFVIAVIFRFYTFFPSAYLFPAIFLIFIIVVVNIIVTYIVFSIQVIRFIL